jgi:hypothetical protein
MGQSQVLTLAKLWEPLALRFLYTVTARYAPVALTERLWPQFGWAERVEAGHAQSTQSLRRSL